MIHVQSLFRVGMPAWGVLFLVLMSVLAMGGCGTTYDHNPSFHLSDEEARDAIAQMKSKPGKLKRPVVVLGGWRDMNDVEFYIADELRPLLDDDRVLAVDYTKCDSFAETQQVVVEAVNERFPSNIPGKTVEVDVVAYSMGGLVARYAARKSDYQPQLDTLNIVRLFTISSPHRGASAAQLPAIDKFMQDMRSDSEFIAELKKPDYQTDFYRVYPYVRLGDIIVGTQNAAPMHRTPWWVPNKSMQEPHFDAYADPRFIADIARRLRNEPAYSRYPAAPIPKDKKSQQKPSSRSAQDTHNASVHIRDSGI